MDDYTDNNSHLEWPPLASYPGPGTRLGGYLWIGSVGNITLHYGVGELTLLKSFFWHLLLFLHVSHQIAAAETGFFLEQLHTQDMGQKEAMQASQL